MATTDPKVKRLAEYIRKNPDDSFSKFALALEFIKINKADKARILFENIRSSDPDYLGVYYHLGSVYEQLGKLQEAMETYEQGIRKAREQNDERTASELNEVLAELKYELE